MIKLSEIKSKIEKKDDFVIGEKEAVDQLCELLKYYDIDIDRLMSDKDSENSGEKTFNTAIRFIQQGKFEVKKDPNGGVKVVQYLKSKQTLEYAKIGARHKMCMDGFSPNEFYRRIYALVASLVNLPISAIEQLDTADIAVVEILGALFLLA